MNCNDLLCKDPRDYKNLIHCSTDVQPTRSLPLAALALERDWAVNVVVLLANPETIAQKLKQSIPAAQAIIARFRRPFPIPVSSFKIESNSIGYWAAEPDLFGKLMVFSKRFDELEEQYPHLGGVFSDLKKEFQACLEG